MAWGPDQRPSPSRAALLSAGAAALAAAGAAALLTVGAQDARPGSGAQRLTATEVAGVGRPTAAAAAAGRLWAVELASRRLHEIDAARGEPVRPPRQLGSAGALATDVAATAGGAWVAIARSGTGWIVRVDAAGGRRRVIGTGDVPPSRIAALPGAVALIGDGRVAALGVRGGRRWARPLPGALDVAAGYGSVWTLATAPQGGGLVTRLEPATGRVVGRRAISGAATALAVGQGAVWVANGCAGGVLRAPVGPGPASCLPVADGATGVAVGAGGVWVADGDGARLLRLEPGSGNVAAVAWTGTRPTAVATGSGAVWGLSGGGPLLRVGAAPS
jgi:hypothetical protein